MSLIFMFGEHIVGRSTSVLEEEKHKNLYVNEFLEAFESSSMLIAC